LPQQLPRLPSHEVLEAFVGYLKGAGTAGGGSVKMYLARLPTALALHHGQRPSDPRLVIPPAIQAMCDRAARVVPQVHPVVRDAVSLPELVNIVNDTDAHPLVAAAIVMQYTLGARGINVYSTGKSREAKTQLERPLQWRDIRYLPAANGEPDTWLVTLRQEKTATSYTGSFAPKALTRSPDVSLLPCPVHALDVARRFRNSSAPEALLFPGVRDDHVNQLLKRHSAPGRKLSTHSLRKARVTTLKESGVEGSDMRLAGNWKNDAMPDRYAATRGTHSANVSEKLVKAQHANQQVPKIPEGEAAAGTQDHALEEAVGVNVVPVPDPGAHARAGAGQQAEADGLPADGVVVAAQRKAHKLVGTIHQPKKGQDRLVLLVQSNGTYFWGYYYFQHVCAESLSPCV